MSNRIHVQAEDDGALRADFADNRSPEYYHDAAEVAAAYPNNRIFNYADVEFVGGKWGS